MERRMMVSQEIKIMAYEVDAMGFVSNIVYVKWFEDLRHAMLDIYYPFREMMKSNISPVLMRTEVDYKAPLKIFDRPTGIAWVSNMDKIRWEIMFEIRSGDTVHCIGKQQGCYFDIDIQRPTRTPHRMLSAYLNEQES